MAEHALLSASSAHRWLACTPSARQESKLPETTSVYAEEGTLAHEVAYWFVRGKILSDCSLTEYDAAMEKCQKDPLYTHEMLECAELYGGVIDTALRKARESCADAKVFLEVRLDYSKWVPEGFGTGDCVVIGDKYIEVVDYKYGRGVQVEAADNPQMMLYGLGAYAKYAALYDFGRIRMTIVQPRIQNVCGDELPVQKLLAWGEYIVKPQALKAFNGDGDFAPGEKACKFCRCCGTCRARAKRNLDLFDEQSTENMTVDEIGAVLKRAAGISNWLKALEAEVTAALSGGAPVRGWKLVEGRSIRRFRDESEAVQKLTTAGFDRRLLFESKLLSVSQLEKTFGKKLVDEVLADVIEKPEGAPTLAPETDRRPAYMPKEQILKAFEED